MNIARHVLGRRFLLLAGLAVALAYVTLSPQSAYARPCCHDCDWQLQGCIAGCGGDSQCEVDCQTAEQGCYAVCDSSPECS